MSVELLIVVEKGSESEACASQSLADTCGGMSLSRWERCARNNAFQRAWMFKDVMLTRDTASMLHAPVFEYNAIRASTTCLPKP